MRICKYCGNLIEGEPVMNPDENGDGYHHFCLVDKEFREQNRSIFQKGYDKGKADMLDEIRARVELEKLGYPPSAGYYQAIVKVLQIIDKHRKGESK